MTKRRTLIDRLNEAMDHRDAEDRREAERKAAEEAKRGKE